MYLFVVNEVSGKGRGREVWAYVQKRLQEMRVPHEAVCTEGPGHAEEIARDAREGKMFKAIIAVGGDGTVNEVGNGVIGSDLPIGYIPAGTGNDFALAHRIPLDPEWALERILRHQVYQVDTGMLKERHMIGFMGIGFDAKVAEAVNMSQRKRWLGRLTYGIEAIKTLKSFKPQPAVITVDGRRYEYDGVWLVAVANIPNYAGGIRICPHAQMNDGLLDLCCVRNLTPGQFLRVFPSAYRGKHIHHPSVVFHSGREITIETDAPFIAHVDGEVLGGAPVTVRVAPKSLSIL
ncbi:MULTISPECIES: diacylglycerol kinase family protein [unclassified Thermoactinomyces]|jgi:diacylglycerol kinase (ATP)|uniref:diacylglycerol/lipid kinase family protein n=1 Tax=unclassified Thermoactinomyces TaxID=2634588 RepID=UPI0018DB38F3|nr:MULTISPECIES: diacylglycerol kinase family protein [unclassified Thermoactinomyces]MBH8598909.1 diacylglycerol kinase family lipid kinase [Thermoactinomyces sp. CICC 10523]MBH8604894.1 diacylglycerol kinase family lipid kinase [Thermoactinomyces sp. CICC 10522]MBH8608390.1 diacylglycerol kinase family lipid kinase [Thermoactinomyces sp. CICC 10521]